MSGPVPPADPSRPPETAPRHAHGGGAVADGGVSSSAAFEAGTSDTAPTRARITPRSGGTPSKAPAEAQPEVKAPPEVEARPEPEARREVEARPEVAEAPARPDVRAEVKAAPEAPAEPEVKAEVEPEPVEGPAGAPAAPQAAAAPGSPAAPQDPAASPDPAAPPDPAPQGAAPNPPAVPAAGVSPGAATTPAGSEASGASDGTGSDAGERVAQTERLPVAEEARAALRLARHDGAGTTAATPGPLPDGRGTSGTGTAPTGTGSTGTGSTEAAPTEAAPTDTQATDTEPTETAATESAETSAGETGSADEPIAPVRSRDPVLVHFVWEAALAGLLVVLAVCSLVLLPAVRSTSFFVDILGAAAPIGVLAMAFSLSLRGAVPNLAVVPLGALAGAMYTATVEDVGTTGAVLRALVLTAVLGLLIGALVVGLRVPSWAGSVAVGLLATGLALSVAPESGLVSAIPEFATGKLRVFAVFAVVSIAGGLLCLVPAVRRTLGAYREEDGGVLAGVMAVLVLVVSSVVAGVGGLLLVFGSGSSSPGLALELWLPLTAVVLGGASLYGRRVGVAGTVLGVLLLTAVRDVWLASDVEPAVTGAGVVLALAGIGGILGLLATPLVEWSGRRAEVRESP
jgi:ribose/xylose/arabinose/galactoside ABC-type transport system permease subunit